MKIVDYLPEMLGLLEKWSEINSHARNVAGIEHLLQEMVPTFSRLLPDRLEILKDKKDKPIGLYAEKRPRASLKAFFGGHIDTVFPVDHPFQKVKYLDQERLSGPGVADMKGGLVILFFSLLLFETLPEAKKLGWRIFLNCDEEIGSPNSTPFFAELSKECAFALLFEPAAEDGALISARRGSANYLCLSHGIAGHAGRDLDRSQNAIVPLAHFISEISLLIKEEEGVSLNIGKIHGGTAKNIVPDYAECHLNIRFDTQEQMSKIQTLLQTYAQKYHLTLTQESMRPPKLCDAKTEKLIEELSECGTKLSLPLRWKKTGGVCDGNTLAAHGIPTLDTLGVEGGGLHTDKEWMRIKSLVEKGELVVNFLVRMSS